MCAMIACLSSYSAPPVFFFTHSAFKSSVPQLNAFHSSASASLRISIKSSQKGSYPYLRASDAHTVAASAFNRLLTSAASASFCRLILAASASFCLLISAAFKSSSCCALASSCCSLLRFCVYVSGCNKAFARSLASLRICVRLLAFGSPGFLSGCATNTKRL